MKRLLANAKTAHLATVEACNRASSARVSLSGTASAWEVLANDARSKEAHARQALVVEAETWKALACAALDWQDIVPIGEPYEAISPGENAPNLDPAKIARMALEKQALALESLAEFHSRPEHQQAVSKEPQQQKTLGLTVDDQPSSSEEAISDFTTTNLSEIHPFEREARVLSFDLLKNSPHTSEPRSTIVLVTILILVSIAIFLTCVAPPDDRPPDVIAISIAKAVAPWYLGGCLIALFGFLLQRKGR